MQVKLIFLGAFDTEYKGEIYTIYQFLHPNSMTILSGTNLQLSDELKLDEDYQCEIALRRGKMKVISVLQ